MLRVGCGSPTLLRGRSSVGRALLSHVGGSSPLAFISLAKFGDLIHQELTRSKLFQDLLDNE